MKKFLSITLILIIALSSFGASAEELKAVKTTTVDSGFREDAVFQLGLMDADLDGDKKLDEEESRVDFAISVYRALCYSQREEQPIAFKAVYSDVDKMNYAAGYLEYLTSIGIINGYGDGTFQSGKKITFQEAYTMLVRAAGFFRKQNVGEAMFLERAKKLGLISRVNKAKDAVITREEAANMLYELLFAEYMRAADIGTGETSFDNNTEFIIAVMQLGYTDGILTSADGLTLYDEDADERKLKVDGKSFNNAQDLGSELLGYKVRLIYDPDTEDALAVYTPNGNDILEIDAELINSYKNRTYSYYQSESGGRIMSATVAKDADVLYNDYVCFDNSLLNPSYGKVVLIDNNGDGTYEVVRAYGYESYLYDSYLSDKEGIELMFKNIDSSGRQAMIKLGDYDTVKIDGMPGEVQKLVPTFEKDDVITVCRTKNKVITLYITKTRVTGAIKSLKDKNGSIEVTLDEEGGSYLLAPNVYTEGWDKKTFDTVELLLDKTGRAAGVFAGAAATDENAPKWKFGYIFGVKYKDTKEQLIIKVLSDNNEIKILTAEERLKIDGNMYKDLAVAERHIKSIYNDFADFDSSGNELITTRMMRYFESGDKLTKIDTPYVQSLYNSSTPPDYGEDNKLLLRAKGKLYQKWITDYMNFKTIYPEDAEVLGEVNFKNADDPVFIVPEEITDATDETKDYLASTIKDAGFKNEKWRVLSGYNLEPDNLWCSLMAIRMPVGSTGDKRISMVQSVDKVLTAEGNREYAITSFFGGKEAQTLPIKTTSDILGDKLLKGDVILYQNINGEIFVNEILYRTAELDDNMENGKLNDAIKAGNNFVGSNLNGDVAVFTKIKRRNNGWINVDAPRSFDVLIREMTDIEIYDMTLDKFFAGTTDDVKTEKTHGSEADDFIYYYDTYRARGGCAIRK